MYGSEVRPEAGTIEECRERIYSFLATLFSHPDEGTWGRVLKAGAQRSAIATADAIRAAASELEYPLSTHELDRTELDLRSLILELCQPLEHLKAEYERVLCGTGPRPACSPHELDHREDAAGDELQADSLADLALFYRAFGFSPEHKLPGRPDSIRFELEFMGWLLGQRRLATRMAAVDGEAAEQVHRCDLAQRTFFSDHLSGWVPSFANSLQKYTGGGYFEPLGRFLAAWIPLERHLLVLEPRSVETQSRRKRLPVGT